MLAMYYFSPGLQELSRYVTVPLLTPGACVVVMDFLTITIHSGTCLCDIE